MTTISTPPPLNIAVTSAMPSTSIAPLSNASMLPAPIVDPLAALYGLAAAAAEAQGKKGKADVESKFDEKAKVEKEVAAAVERARRAHEEEKGFFDSLGIGSLVGIAASQPMIVVADMGLHMARMTPDFIESFEKDHAQEISLAAKAFCAVNNASVLADGLYGNQQAYYAMIALGGLVVQESGVLGKDASDYAGAAMLTYSGGTSPSHSNAIAVVANKDSATADKIRQAEKDTRDYTKWIALAGMAVAAAGAVVATAGTASVVVVGIGIALSASGFLVSETRCFGDKASMWIGSGLGLAGAVMTGAGAAGAASTAARVMTGAGKAVEGVAEMRAGGDRIRVAATEHAVGEANVDAQAHRFEARRLEQLIEEIIESVRDAKDSAQRVMSTLSETMDTQNQTRLIAVNALRG